jgi:hypothetical protein
VLEVDDVAPDRLAVGPENGQLVVDEAHHEPVQRARLEEDAAIRVQRGKGEAPTAR